MAIKPTGPSPSSSVVLGLPNQNQQKRDSVKKTVLECIAEVKYGGSLPKSFDTSQTPTSLGFDSLDQAELIMEIESSFNIQLPTNDDTKIVGMSIEKIIDYLVNKV